MKRFTLPLAALVLFAFAACDDNTKINETPADPSAIAATYNGYSYSESAMQAFPWTADGETLTITANTDHTAALSFDSKGQWGSYTVEKLSFVKKGDLHTVAGTGKVSLGGMGGGPAKEYEFTMTGTIKSKDEATFVFVASVGAMGEITTTFVTGQMPDALKITGTYTGYSEVSYFGSVQETHENQNIVITPNENGTVNLSFSDKDNEDWMWGEYKLEELAITQSEGIYKIAGSGDAYISNPSGDGDPVGPYSYTMEGNIVSTTDAGITFILALGGMGNINIAFTTGTAPVTP